MYNKTSFINETDYAELAGLWGICPIMRKIMHMHNRIIPRFLAKSKLKNSVAKVVGVILSVVLV